jgi:hypothetical protein
MRSDLSPQAGRGKKAEALLQQFSLKRSQHAFEIANHIIIPESKSSVALLSQATISYRIGGRFTVLPTADFNN